MNSTSCFRVCVLVLIGLVIPGVASAHVGVGETQGLLHGFGHPIGGLDHILAMIAVGLWAAQRGGRFLWTVPATFVVVMALGGLSAAAGLSIPFVEAGIVTSVFVLGAFIAMAAEIPLLASVLAVGLFALFHGHAHGTEMPLDASGLTYGLGFVLATASLHIAGIGLSRHLRGLGNQMVVRYAGGAIALCGICLWLAA